MGSSLATAEVRYSSWAEAASKVSFPLREPRWLPEGYWLSALQSFVPDIDGGAPTPNAVIATYSGPGRDYIVFDQFWVERLEEFDVASTLPRGTRDSGHGVIQVGSHAAFWRAGLPTREHLDGRAVWDETISILTWVDGQMGYRVQGKNATLSTLTRVAIEAA